jgi:1-acyl-sn-glycerol-3-phosphate acyltransferase
MSDDNASSGWLEPTREELGVLAPMERLLFRVAYRMNRGLAKAFWSWFQRVISARVVRMMTRGRLKIHGIEHVTRASRERPILLVANHRSFFDMYVVSSSVLKMTPGARRFYFPVRGRFFYTSPVALLLNAFAGWSMFPPIFPQASRRAFNYYSVRLLTALCRSGRGHVIGIHPEGSRNLGADPYLYLPPQSGVGRLVYDAAPQVIPVFIVGLGNSLAGELASAWRGNRPIRIHFGETLIIPPPSRDVPRARTYREISELLMRAISELGEQDRAMYASDSSAPSADRKIRSRESAAAEEAS